MVVAGFDFDGTLTKRDTLIPFIASCLGLPGLAAAGAAAFPLMVARAVRHRDSGRAKELLFGACFRGMAAARFEAAGKAFAENRLPTLLRPSAMAAVERHRAAGHRLVIVTASMAAWIMPWARGAGFSDVIATQPEIDGGVLTGRFDGPNCRGPEKVRRFLEEYPRREAYELFFYGDGSGDRDLLELADHAFLRTFVEKKKR